MKKEPNRKKMGRPPKQKGTTKPHVVSARFTDAEHGRIKKAAAQKAISEWARQALLRASSEH